jgi:hypothetical protein
MKRLKLTDIQNNFGVLKSGTVLLQCILIITIGISIKTCGWKHEIAGK